ncbi:inorganic phosphate transporter, partial [Zhongshania aliphaticivorans]|jgi:PiT family inorganic phosphate transporter
VEWGKVGQIVASWVVSPVMAGTISFGIFLSAQRLILNTQNPFEAAKKYIPYYLFLVGFMIAMVTMTKGLKHIGLGLNFQECLGYSTIVGIIVAGIGQMFLRRIKDVPSGDGRFRFANVERMFAVLMVFTACAMAFAHGSNDVANAIGPVAAVVSVIQSGGEIGAKSALPSWILLVGAGGIVFGLATYGFKVIATIGTKITELTPSRGFAAELGAASTVVVASATGLPISTTHTLVGAVLGVGLARGIAALNLSVIRNIFMSWIITLPAGAGLAIVFFFIFKAIFL